MKSFADLDVENKDVNLNLLIAVSKFGLANVKLYMRVRNLVTSVLIERVVNKKTKVL